MGAPATDVEILLMALYTAKWDEREMAEWASTYIAERRDRSRVPFGRLAVIRNDLYREWQIVDLDAIAARVADEVDEARS